MMKFRTVGYAHKLACTQQYTIDIVVDTVVDTVVDIALEVFEVQTVVDIALGLFEAYTVVAILEVGTVVEVVVWFDVVGGTLVGGGYNACYGPA